MINVSAPPALLFYPTFIEPRDCPPAGTKALVYEKTRGTKRIRWDGGGAGLPCGHTAWLILVYLTTVAVQTRERHINIGIHQFLLELGFTDISDHVIDQLLALASSRLTLIQGQATMWSYKGMTPIQEVDLGAQKIMLSNTFFDAILNHSFPVDRRAVQLVCSLEDDRNSVGALDAPVDALEVHTWLAARMWMVTSSGNGTFISWKDLAKHFGVSDLHREAFQSCFADYLRLFQQLYPAGHVQVVEDRGVGLSPTDGRV